MTVDLKITHIGILYCLIDEVLTSDRITIGGSDYATPKIPLSGLTSEARLIEIKKALNDMLHQADKLFATPLSEDTISMLDDSFLKLLNDSNS
jgi:hypothetical protein